MLPHHLVKEKMVKISSSKTFGLILKKSLLCKRNVLLKKCSKVFITKFLKELITGIKFQQLKTKFSHGMKNLLIFIIHHSSLQPQSNYQKSKTSKVLIVFLT